MSKTQANKTLTKGEDIIATILDMSNLLKALYIQQVTFNQELQALTKHK